jgi:EAL domain-containing protein (putative c-di-GMP-specific phosphodiesterase class I)
VHRSLERHQLDPRLLVLEITEAVFAEEIESAAVNLAQLRDHGVLIALDDFGTGHCSLSYLQQFPVDMVKIDRQFIDELDGEHRNMPLAEMILQLTSVLDVISVAEGIERPAQLRALKALGCDVGQGYLLSGPLEADEVRRRFGAAYSVAPR